MSDSLFLMPSDVHAVALVRMTFTKVNSTAIDFSLQSSGANYQQTASLSAKALLLIGYFLYSRMSII